METARSAEQVAGDDLALDLAGALVDPGSPDQAIPTANAPTLGRNRSSVRMATLNPASTSPRTSSGPTGTPSNRSRPIAWGARSSSGSPDRPSASPGTANAVTPFEPASGVVLANTVYTSASGAL